MMEKNTEETQKLILECMALAFAVQENTEYCVFIDFSGHVNSCMISIRESKERYQNKACESEIQTAYKEYYSKDEVNIHLKSVRDVLKQILKDGEIPYEMLTRHVEQVYNYSF